MEPGPYDEDASVAETIARGVAPLTYDRLEDPVVSRVEAAFVDTVGVGLRGAQTEPGRIARVTATGDGDVTCWADRTTAPLTGAGFANGTAAHALDYDDVTDAIIGHPSACLVPTILALAEADSVTGAEAITAYVAGFETAAALSNLLNPEHYEGGWHATATLGAFGAAAAAASALGLDVEETAVAINLTASMASGLKRNFGSMAKPMHVGVAVRSGLSAGLLAGNGFDAAGDPFGGRGGFFDLYRGTTETGAAAVDVPGTGGIITTVGIDEKKYPCCYFSQSAIEAALEVGADIGEADREVTAVEVVASQGADDALSYPAPTTSSEARFSMEHVVAAALVDGTVGIETFADRRWEDPAISTVRDRVSFEVDPDLPYESYETRLRIRTRDGQEYAIEKSAPPGAHSNPLTTTERRKKFTANVAPVLDSAAAETMYHRLTALREEPEAAGFLGELRGSG